MASSADPRPLLPGEPALADRPRLAHPNPAGGDYGITLRELAHAGKINLRGGSALHGPATTVTGCASLPVANQFVSAGDRHLVWLGPDEYLLLCEAGAETELKQRLDSLIGTSKAVATDVSDAICALELRGPAIRQTLAKGCSLDLHHSIFTAGHAAQTALAHAGVTIIAHSDDRFWLLCRTSFAAYVQQWLCDAALEYGVHFTS
jgi:sarcosine oxidase subunit gamma